MAESPPEAPPHASSLGPSERSALEVGMKARTRRRRRASWVQREGTPMTPRSFRPFGENAEIGRCRRWGLSSSIYFHVPSSTPLQRITRQRPALIQRAQPFASARVQCVPPPLMGFVAPSAFWIAGSVRRAPRSHRAGLPTPAHCVLDVFTPWTPCSARDLLRPGAQPRSALGVPFSKAAPPRARSRPVSSPGPAA